MTVTALKQTSQERFTLTLADGEEIKTTLGVVAAFRLYSEKELFDAELSELRAASSLALCKSRALEMINRRPLSKKELADKLREKGESAEDSESCAAWVEEIGLINEADYAGMIVRHYAEKGCGAGRIRTELFRRGIPRELWEDALTQMPEQSDKLQRYIASRLTDPEDRAQVKKVSDGLYRRGYSWDEIRHALEEFRANIEDD